MKRTILISILLVLTLNLYRANTQELDPIDILKTVVAKQNQINDYQVNIEIELDVDFVNMPVKHAMIYCKQPERIKFKSDEFIMLPKRGTNFTLWKIIKEDFTAIFSGYDYLNQHQHCIIKVIPLKKNQILFFQPSG